MSQRPRDPTKWLWILVIYASPSWNPVQCVTVKVPPKTPSTIEAQAKFFQDFFSVQLSPYKLEFGHVCEDPDTWEQRYEKKDFKNHRDMGKVRWGDKKGGYGEHYWDLNHAGHAGDHDHGYEGNSDDGSYREEHNNDLYEESPEYSSPYGDGYDPEKASKSDDINRAKRAHPRTRNEKKTYKVYDEDDNNERAPIRKKKVEQNISYKPIDQDSYKKTVTAKQQNNYDNSDEANDQTEEDEQESDEDENERKQVVLVLSQKEKGDYKDPSKPHKSQQLTSQQPQQFQASQFNQDPQQFNPIIPQQVAQQTQPSYVPYEGGAGLRQHQQPETSASAAVSRLFLEPSTGHIIDRATGRAYVLQPLQTANYE